MKPLVEKTSFRTGFARHDVARPRHRTSPSGWRTGWRREAVSRLESFLHFGNSDLFRISDFGFRIYGRLLPLALLLLASWQFSASATPTKSGELATGRVRPTGGHAKTFGVAKTASIAPDGEAYSPIAASSSIDGIDCITSENQEKQPAPDGGNSPNLPDATSDIDDTDGGLDDFSADPSTRNDWDTPLFSVTGLDAVALRTARIAPILLFPVHCFYCLHEHIRERAPPTVS
jgi:hypothetical protein